MENYNAEINSVADSDDSAYKTSWKPLLRQIYVCTGVWACFFNFGLCFGAPTVFIPQIRREANSTDAVSMEMASWLSSCLNYSGIPSVILLSYLSYRLGRKRAYIFVTATSLIGFIIFYTSSSTLQILISIFFQGPLAACQTTLSLMVITEYVSPCYRGMFLTIKSATFLWGIWVSNTIGTYMHWKNIAILGSLIAIYTLVTAITWPESPYWLAGRDKFEECSRSHRWLKGNGSRSEEELKTLINTQQSREKKKKIPVCKQILNVHKVVSSRLFYRPLIIAVLLLAMYNFSGKIACAVYAIDIIKKITGSEPLAYKGMLILDGVTVVGMYIGCGLSKVLKRRVLLTGATIVGVLFLLILSAYTYLVKLNILIENNYITIVLLTGFSLAISCGPLIISTTVVGEVIPLKARSTFTLTEGIVANAFMGTFVKITPLVISSFDSHGTFLFYAIISSILLIFIYKYVPETKDRTLVEIENYMKFGKFKVDKEMVGFKNDFPTN